jgi:hypothetical protein
LVSFRIRSTAKPRFRRAHLGVETQRQWSDLAMPRPPFEGPLLERAAGMTRMAWKFQPPLGID